MAFSTQSYDPATGRVTTRCHDARNLPDDTVDQAAIERWLEVEALRQQRHAADAAEIREQYAKGQDIDQAARYGVQPNPARPHMMHADAALGDTDADALRAGCSCHFVASGGVDEFGCPLGGMVADDE